MKSYYRVMLGKGSNYAAECFKENFIGVDFGIHQDLSGKFSNDWHAFNKEFIHVFMATHPDITNIGAGLACWALWEVAKGIKIGDSVICADGSGGYRVAEVTGDYFYQADGVLPHRRPVHWLSQTIYWTDISDALRNALEAPGAVSDITEYRFEIERLLDGPSAPKVVSNDETIKGVAAFITQRNLEHFLVQNWEQTDLGKEYDICAEDGERVGQQYRTDTGFIDILAIGKDKTSLLVVELNEGRVSSDVVGHVLYYMGYVQEELAGEGQTVKGAIVGLGADQRMRRALAMVPTIDFYRYQISFKLMKS